MANKSIKKVEDYYKVITSESGDTAEILLYGYIGQEDYWGEDPEKDITDAAFAKSMRELEKNNTRINVRINSPGGSMYHGNAIITAIQNSSAEVHTYNDGLAASMGADIWLSSKNRHMADNSVLMIHGPAGGCYGTAKKMRQKADALDAFEEGIVAMMLKATDMSEEDIRKEFYDGEDHYLSIKKCEEYGFLTEDAEKYESENNLPADIDKMSYEDIVKHFDTKNDKESKGILSRLADKFYSSITNRVKSAPTVTQNTEDMKVEEFNKEVGEQYTHEDFVKCLEDAGYTVTAPVAEKSVEEKIADAVKAANDARDQEIADLKADIAKLGKAPEGEVTIPAKDVTVDERFAGKTAEQIKMIKELEDEAAKEAAEYR